MPIINPSIPLPKDTSSITFLPTNYCQCSGHKVDEYTICSKNNILCTAARVAVKYTLDKLSQEDIITKTIEALAQIYSE